MPDPEKLESWEIVNLEQGAGDTAPPATAYLTINGVSFETDVDALERLGTQAKAAKKRAKDGMVGRVGSIISVRELTRGVQGVLAFDEKEEAKSAKETPGPKPRKAAN